MPQTWSSSPLPPGASPRKGGRPLQVIMLYDDGFPSPSIQRLTNINPPSTGMRGLNIATFIPRQNKRTKRKLNGDSPQVRRRPPYRAIWRHCESGPWHWKASSAAGQVLPGRSLIYAQGMKKYWSVESCTGSERREPRAWRDKVRATSARNERPAQENSRPAYYNGSSSPRLSKVLCTAADICVGDAINSGPRAPVMNGLLNKTRGPTYYKCSSSPRLSKVLCKWYGERSELPEQRLIFV